MSEETRMTVQEAIDARAAQTGETKAVHDLIECCLNAEAAFSMMGCKAPKRRDGFLPVGVMTLVQIGDLLATMPDEAALVKASMAFACEYCGNPAETCSDDCWICDECHLRCTHEGSVTSFCSSGGNDVTELASHTSEP